MQNDLFYFNETLKRAITIERFKQHNVNNLNELFKRVDDYMKTLNDLETINESVITKIKSDLENIYKDFGLQLTDTMKDVFVDSYQFEQASVMAAYPEAKLAIAAIPAETTLATLAAAAVVSQPLMLEGDKGRLLSSLLSDFTTAEAELVANRVRAGHFEGKSIPEMIKEIRGTKQGNYKDGLLETSRRHAEAIARTGIQQAACAARNEFAQQNSDIIEGIQFIATLDSRTCLVKGTLISTPNGDIPIEAIKKGDLVYGGSGEVRKVSGTLKSKSKKLCRVLLSNGIEIVTTQDHLWWNGKAWVEAADLKKGDILPKTLLG